MAQDAIAKYPSETRWPLKHNEPAQQPLTVQDCHDMGEMKTLSNYSLYENPSTVLTKCTNGMQFSYVR
jgi:hypothetical protein